MMPRGDLRVKFASFGKLPRMKKPIGRIISDWLGCGAACPKPANSLLAVASEDSLLAKNFGVRSLDATPSASRTL